MLSDLKAVTFNLRCSWKGDGVNSFVHRAGLIWEKLKEESPDVIAFQEVVPESLELLKLLMPGYVFLGQGREVRFGGEGLYTAVKNSTVSPVGFDTFWIAPDPFDPKSKFEDQSNCPRICVAALLRHLATGRLFYVYNVHLDHVGCQARIKGMDCVLKRMAKDAEKRNAPALLMGDFNDTPDSVVVRRCSFFKDVPLVDATKNIPCTFHNFGRDNSGIEKIDYIFHTKDLCGRVTGISAWKDVLNGIYLSDHYPVCVNLDLTANE